MKKLILILGVLLMMQGICVAAEPEVVVAVVSGQFAAEVSCEGEFEVRVKETGKTYNFAAGKYFVNSGDGNININDIKIGNSTIVLQAVDKSKRLEVNKKIYRGIFEIKFANDGKTLLIVNILPLEEYLYGVVGQEISIVFPDEAIKAQAVAARSFAYSQLGQRSQQGYDLRSATGDQVYAGVSGENTAINKLIDATRGEIATYNGKAITAKYFASSGGYTESNINAWGIYIPYLQSVVDFDQDAPGYKWEKELTAQNIENALSRNGYAIGKLESIRLTPLTTMPVNATDRSRTGRVSKIAFAGDVASVILKGTEASKILNLNSNLFEVIVNRPLPKSLDVPIENSYGMQIGKKEIEINVKDKDRQSLQDVFQNFHFVSRQDGEKITFKGRGQGHGVGMSQWGAKGMADNAPLRSKNYYREILKHYYTDIAVEKIY